jgi:hypothetical protein
MTCCGCVLCFVAECAECAVLVAASACETACGLNTICVGDWANAAELTCKCISEAYESATGDGKNCDGKMMCSVVSCDAGCKFDHACLVSSFLDCQL